MFLKIDETSVIPSGLQLFDHVITGLGIECLSSSWSPEAICRARVSLGFVNHPERIVLKTMAFPLCRLPELDRFNRLLYQHKLIPLQIWGYEAALLNFLFFTRRGIHVFFRIKDGRMTHVLVQLGGLRIRGRVM